MKKRVSVISIIIVLISFVCISFAGDKEYMPPNSIPNIGTMAASEKGLVHYKISKDIISQIDLPEIPDELPVYMIIKEELTEEQMKAVGDKFGMGENGKVNYTFLDSPVYTGEGYEIAFLNGSVNEFKFTDFKVKQTIGSTFPTETERVKVAKSFLKKRGLWHDDFKYVKFRGSKPEVVFFNKGFNKDSYSYKRAEVTILAGSKIKNVYYKAIEAPVYKLVKTIKRADAFRRMARGEVLITPPGTLLEKDHVIDSCKLDYIGSKHIDENDRSGTYTPVYLIRGHRNLDRFTLRVSAVEDTYLKKAISIIVKVSMNPDTLSLSGSEKWVNFSIQFDKGYDLSNLDAASIFIEHEKGAIYCDPNSADLSDAKGRGASRVSVNFDKASIKKIVEVGDPVSIVIKGYVGEKPFHTPFQGVAYIKVTP